MWDLPTPGLKPVSPALAGRFSSAAPPGKPWGPIFLRGFCFKGSLGLVHSLLSKSMFNLLELPVVFAFPLNVLYLDKECIFLYGFLVARMFIRAEFLSVRTAAIGQFGCSVVPSIELDTL